MAVTVLGRRTRLHRSFAVAATTALVVGVGTVTVVAPWSRTPNRRRRPRSR